MRSFIPRFYRRQFFTFLKNQLTNLHRSSKSCIKWFDICFVRATPKRHVVPSAAIWRFFVCLFESFTVKNCLAIPFRFYLSFLRRPDVPRTCIKFSKQKSGEISEWLSGKGQQTQITRSTSTGFPNLLNIGSPFVLLRLLNFFYTNESLLIALNAKAY